MRVVDSRVWTDTFSNAEHPATDLLQLLPDHGEVRLAATDLALFEVLRNGRH